jgi:hypothetical protein
MQTDWRNNTRLLIMNSKSIQADNMNEHFRHNCFYLKAPLSLDIPNQTDCTVLTKK